MLAIFWRSCFIDDGRDGVYLKFFARGNLEVLYRFFVLKKVAKGADGRSCGNIMNRMSMCLQHLYHHPEWDIVLSKDNIRGYVVIDDINIGVLPNPLCQCTSSPKKDRIFGREDIEIDLFLRSDRFKMMIDSAAVKECTPRLHRNSLRQDHSTRLQRKRLFEIVFYSLFIRSNDIFRCSIFL